MSEPLLREATRADIPQLAKHRRWMFEEMTIRQSLPYTAQSLEKIETDWLAQLEDGLGKMHFIWVIEEDDKVVASAGFSAIPWLPHPAFPFGTMPYFHTVWTDSTHRRRGLAARLTQAAMDFARRRGEHVMVLHASDAGRSVYLSQGFKLSNEMRLRF